MKLERFLRPLLHLAYPNVCVACESLLAEGETYVCAECQNGLDVFLSPNESTEKMMSTLAAHFPNQTVIDDAIALYAFHKQGKLQAMIHAFKYDGLSRLALEQGRRLGEAILREKPQSRFAFVAPMPLHPIRRIERGYNQAERLAAGVSEVIGVPVREVVARSRYTQTQTGFSLDGRRANIANAFERKATLQGEPMLLVDDVFTTGATMMECAKALKDAGAGKITIAALAVAVSW